MKIHEHEYPHENCIDLSNGDERQEPHMPTDMKATAGHFFKATIHAHRVFFLLFSSLCLTLSLSLASCRSLWRPVCWCLTALSLFINSWAECVLDAGFWLLRCHAGCALCHNRIQIVVNLWTYIIMCLSIISIIIANFLEQFFFSVRTERISSSMLFHSYFLFNWAQLIVGHWILPHL